MNYLVYPVKFMNITQRYDDNFSHSGNTSGEPKDYPIDEACENTNRSYFYCPCDRMKIVRIYGVGGSGTNTIWLESLDIVTTPTFSDYVTMLVMHPNDDTLKDLYVGQVFNRGDEICLEGNDGYATGYHFHISVARGKFVPNGWVENNKGAWVITGDAVKPEDAFYIDDNKTKILNSANLSFKHLPIQVGLTVVKDENVAQIEVKNNDVVAYNNINGEKIGLIIPGYYNVIASEVIDNVMWYKTNDNYWIPYDNRIIYYEKKVVSKEENNENPLIDVVIDEACLKKLWHLLLKLFKYIVYIFKKIF